MAQKSPKIFRKLWLFAFLGAGVGSLVALPGMFRLFSFLISPMLSLGDKVSFAGLMLLSLLNQAATGIMLAVAVAAFVGYRGIKVVTPLDASLRRHLWILAVVVAVALGFAVVTQLVGLHQVPGTRVAEYGPLFRLGACVAVLVMLVVGGIWTQALRLAQNALEDREGQFGGLIRDALGIVEGGLLRVYSRLVLAVAGTVGSLWIIFLRVLGNDQVMHSRNHLLGILIVFALVIPPLLHVFFLQGLLVEIPRRLLFDWICRILPFEWIDRSQEKLSVFRQALVLPPHHSFLYRRPLQKLTQKLDPVWENWDAVVATSDRQKAMRALVDDSSPAWDATWAVCLLQFLVAIGFWWAARG